MKKIILLPVFLLTIIFGIHAYAADYAVKSDIGAFIDYTYIESFNISDYTYVIAEDLRDYGFGVTWNNEQRTLSISRCYNAYPYFTQDMWEKLKQERSETETFYRIYPSDIKVYLGSREITGYNLGGKTAVRLEDFWDHANVHWDGKNRTLSLNVYAEELSWEYRTAADTQSADRYTGQLSAETGTPEGIGMSYDMHIEGSYGVAGRAYLGDFSDGKKTGRTVKTFCGNRQSTEKTSNFIGICEPNAYDSSKNTELPITRKFYTDFQDKDLYVSGVYCEQKNSYSCCICWIRSDGHTAVMTYTDNERTFSEYINGERVFSENTAINKEEFVRPAMLLFHDGIWVNRNPAKLTFRAL